MQETEVISFIWNNYHKPETTEKGNKMNHKLDAYFKNQFHGYGFKDSFKNYPVTTILKKEGVHITAAFTSGYIEVPDEYNCNDGDPIYLGHAWRFVITKTENNLSTDLEVFYTNGENNHFFNKLAKSRAPLTAIEQRLKSVKQKYRRGENSVNYFEITDEVFDFLLKRKLQSKISYAHVKNLRDKGFHIPKPKRIDYAHVPPGSIVWSSEMFRMGHAIQHTVKSVSSNGIDSYILEMEEIASRSPTDSYFNSLRNVCFNLSHVDKVIFRPSKVKVFLEESDDAGRVGSDTTKRNYVNIDSYEFSKFVNSIASVDSIVDFEKLRLFLKRQGFVKRVVDENGYFADFFGKKKKVRRWLKQNINRFLKQKKKAREEEESFYESLYDDDF